MKKIKFADVCFIIAALVVLCVPVFRPSAQIETALRIIQVAAAGIGTILYIKNDTEYIIFASMVSILISGVVHLAFLI